MATPITTKQLATLLGVTPATLSKWHGSGKLTYFTVVRGEARYSAKTINKFLARCMKGAQREAFRIEQLLSGEITLITSARASMLLELREPQWYGRLQSNLTPRLH